MSWIVQMASKANRNRDAGAPLTSAQLLAFGFPALTHAMVASPVYGILPTYYAANTMVTLAQIGTIAAFSRIIDALNDPIMGYLSDRTRTRFGGRKPYIVAAILLMAIAVFQLFSPRMRDGYISSCGPRFYTPALQCSRFPDPHGVRRSAEITIKEQE
jgi:Na+/melibiose symporter-like transporter